MDLSAQLGEFQLGDAQLGDVPGSALPPPPVGVISAGEIGGFYWWVELPRLQGLLMRSDGSVVPDHDYRNRS
jgi:hypothetical protein